MNVIEKAKLINNSNLPKEQKDAFLDTRVVVSLRELLPEAAVERATANNQDFAARNTEELYHAGKHNLTPPQRKREELYYAGMRNQTSPQPQQPMQQQYQQPDPNGVFWVGEGPHAQPMATQPSMAGSLGFKQRFSQRPPQQQRTGAGLEHGYTGLTNGYPPIPVTSTTTNHDWFEKAMWEHHIKAEVHQAIAGIERDKLKVLYEEKFAFRFHEPSKILFNVLYIWKMTQVAGANGYSAADAVGSENYFMLSTHCDAASQFMDLNAELEKLFHKEPAPHADVERSKERDAQAKKQYTHIPEFKPGRVYPNINGKLVLSNVDFDPRAHTKFECHTAYVTFFEKNMAVGGNGGIFHRSVVQKATMLIDALKDTTEETIATLNVQYFKKIDGVGDSTVNALQMFSNFVNERLKNKKDA